MDKSRNENESAALLDAMIITGAGAEPTFDSVMQAFLHEARDGIGQACKQAGLLEFANLGRTHPWLYRLTFHTRGLIRDTVGDISRIDRHVVALRFLPDYLRHADRFAMLRLMEPSHHAFHPNIGRGGEICAEVYPGESLIEICHSLHDLFRWRLRQYDERDALNPVACAWGRENIDDPIDDRPLFGQALKLRWQAAASNNEE